MNKYEGMFLLNNSKVGTEPGSATKLVSDLLTKHGATPVRVDVWDERKLAFPIEDQKRGTYVLAHFEAEGGVVKSVTHDVNISEDIMRSLMVRHETEFPTFRIASEMAALQPKKDMTFGDDRRRRDGDEEGGRGRWRDNDDFGDRGPGALDDLE